MEISAILQIWYDRNKRTLPWRETSDPYQIWLSEVILQQTRVAQGMDYYLRFAKRFPTVADLAAASEDEVLKLWQGLGYYSRARNLHAAALQVMDEYGGQFPSDYGSLLRLKGVGPYTAAAVSSFAGGERMAVVDGNVYRVLARLFDLDTPIDTPAGQRAFQDLANQLLDPAHPAKHNQAVMEFGALFCTPQSPSCADCPLADRCLALANGHVESRPIKAGKTKIRERHLRYYLLKYKDCLWVHRRGKGDIWQGLWEYYVEEDGESNTPLFSNTCKTSSSTWKGSENCQTSSSLQPSNSLQTSAGSQNSSVIQPPAFTLRHQLTHQLLTCDFHIVQLDQEPDRLPSDYECITWKEWQKKAVPKPIFEANARFSAFFEEK